METQSVVLRKEYFRNLTAAKKWVREHGFVVSKVDTTPNTWRFRQDDPELFRKSTFRNKDIDDGVYLVLAKRIGGTRKRGNLGPNTPKVYFKGGTCLYWDGSRWRKV
jgi:hypothetical protein